MTRALTVGLLVLALAGAAQAQVVFDWTGNAGTTSWDTSFNWAATGTSYAQPSEEYSGVAPEITGSGTEEDPYVTHYADSWPNYAYLNADITAINIDGATVEKTVEDAIGWTSSSYLVMGGNNCVVTLDNAATLTIGEDMWIAEDTEAAGGVTSQIDILNGSTFNVDLYRIGHGGTGVVNVTNGSTWMCATHWGRLGSYANGSGTINVTDSTFYNHQSLHVGEEENSAGALNLTNSTGTVGTRLRVAGGLNGTGQVSVDNSTLTVGSQYLSVGYRQGSTGTMDITNGSTVTVGDYTHVGNGTDATGTLSITDSSFETGSYLRVCGLSGSTGTLNTTNSTFETGTYIQVGYAENSDGTWNLINSTAVISARMRLAQGPGATAYVKVDNSSLSVGEVSANRLYIAVASNSTDASTATMDVLNGSTVGVGQYILIGTEANATGTLNIDNSSMTVGTDVNVGTKGGTGTLTVTNGATLTMGAHLNSANATTTLDGSGTITVNNATVNTGGQFRVCSGYGTVTADLTDATINTGTEVRVGMTESSIGYLNIHGNTTINCGLDFETCTADAVVSFLGGGEAYTHMYDGDMNIDGYMCLGRTLQGGSYSEFIMDAGTVDIGLNPASAEGHIDNLMLGWFDTDADVQMTLNGGQMTVAGELCFGWGYDWDGTTPVTTTGIDTGQLRLTIDGGILQAEDYVDAGTFTDHLITFTDGQLRINGTAVSETDMANLISGGDINCTGTYYIFTEGAYTVLSSMQQSLIPGDTNGNGIVDETDAATMADHWGQTIAGGATVGDFNADGKVDMLDASILAANWGDHREGAGESVVPEPSVAVLLLGLVLGAAVRRRNR